MYERILVATDGSTLSRKATRSAIAMAALTGGQIVVLHVVPRYPVSYFEGGNAVDNSMVAGLEKQWANAAQSVVEAVTASALASGVKAKAVIRVSDLVAETIISTAKKNSCDLIVMASHGRKGIRRLLMGSETLQVLTHSHIPVLVLR
ncbi:MAG: uncharacterized protein JWP47_2826 [Polaromonas sp.]|jgi:nucleotide-binding universal stress UspA family protein|nr:uncharacterized protein [Polaromonas sp.]